MPDGTVAIIVAAGRGARFGGSVPKPLALCAGEPLVAHALKTFASSAKISSIVLVAAPDQRAAMRRLTDRLALRKVRAIVSGGATRAHSVLAGLKAAPASARLVAIHDGARPCVSREVIERTIAAARKSGAAICAVPATATVKSAKADGWIRMTLDRESLWLAQTPQVFRRDWIVDAYTRAAEANQLADMPDDAAVAESAGYAVRIVPGDASNLKVTTPHDLRIAQALLRPNPAAKQRRGTRSVTMI